MSMNAINLNGQVLESLPGPLALAQRGLYYADSLFETLRVFDGQLPFWPLHWERLVRGLVAMRYRVPGHWSAAFFADEIGRMALRNARVRLTVWRSPGGLYAPADDVPQFLLTAQELDSIVFGWCSDGLQVGLCDSVRLPVDALSGLKTLNAARYVAAAQEAKARGWDEGVVLNARERVCEATSSNVFWVKGDTVCTPPLSEGPVTGTLRFLLLGLLAGAGHRVVEKVAVRGTLLGADEVFLTNAVQGIRWVRSFEGKVLACEKARHFNYLLVNHLREKMGAGGAGFSTP
jgi:branched-chain amino acid aminotransferase